MKEYQDMLRELRIENNLDIDYISKELNYPEGIIDKIENTKFLINLGLSATELKNLLREYSEFLGLSEKNIISMLGRLDYIEFKRLKKGRMTKFDYLNRFTISLLLISIGYIIFLFSTHIKKETFKQTVVNISTKYNKQKSNTTKEIISKNNLTINNK